jgi:hypothetical protein
MNIAGTMKETPATTSPHSPGPAAHIAMMEDEVVRRRGWLTRDEFLDYLGATNLIPGPNSTEPAIHIGHRRAAEDRRPELQKQQRELAERCTYGTARCRRSRARSKRSRPWSSQSSPKRSGRSGDRR